MAVALPFILAGSAAVSTRESLRAKDKTKKRVAGAEQRQKAALADAAADEARNKALSSEAPGAQSAARRRRIGLRSLRVDPGVSFGGGGGGGGGGTAGVGGGLKI